MGFLARWRALVSEIYNLILEQLLGGAGATSRHIHEAMERASETHLQSENILENSNSRDFEGFSSSSQQGPSHEIFLSHSGRQKAFVEQLCKDFKSEGQDPFFDVKSRSLPKGEIFPPRIFKAARECRVAVIVLTEDFLTSKWPMMELITFVDAQKTSNPGLKLYPVLFNGLSFEDLQVDRWKEAWMKLISSQRQVMGSGNHIVLTLEKCAEALRKLRQVAGDNKKYDGSEVDLRMAIVKGTMKLLPAKSDLDMKDIQGAHRLCEVVSSMFHSSDGQSKNVQYLGLFGMGGLGKTTMCRALCNYFASAFDAKVCHVELGASHEPATTLERQKEILCKLTSLRKHFADKIKEPSVAKMYLKERLKDVRVFLAVDNIQDDEASRQEARDYVECISCPGSKVLITSRSQDIVYAVLRERSRCKPIPYLNEGEAMELFLRTAQIDSVSSLNLEETQILRDCLGYCYFTHDDDNDNDSTGYYHPLALRAVACFLQDVPKSMWKEKLLECPELMLHHSRESKDIFNILGLGFDSLCNQGKQLFFDVALHTPPFLDADFVFEWLVGIHGKSGHLIDVKLRELQRKSFLSYQDAGHKISMHDLYKEYAKQYLANNQHVEFGIYLEDPSVVEGSTWSVAPRVSLLWCKVYIAEVQPWSSVVMLHLVQCKSMHHFSIGQLHNLRHLMIMDCSQLNVLSWEQHTVADDQPDSARRVKWGMELRFVNLLHNPSLKSLPDFSQCAYLNSVLVKDCPSLVEPLNFRSCANLAKLQLVGENTPNVELVQACPQLTEAEFAWKPSYGHMPEFRDLPRLTTLSLNGPPSVLDVQSFYSLPSEKIRDQYFLKQYSEDMEDPDLSGIGSLTNLESLDLKRMPLGKLPTAQHLPALQSLDLRGCLLSQLVDFSALSSLKMLVVAWTNVKEVRGIGRLLELEYFDCSYCYRLKKIPNLHRLQKLKVLSIVCCTRLRAVPRLPLAYHRGQENTWRLMHGALSSQNAMTMRSFKAPNPEQGRLRDVAFSASQLTQEHATISCFGCGQRPLIGPRFKPMGAEYRIDVCGRCFTATCGKSDACEARGRITISGMEGFDMSLCLACFELSTGNRDGFYCITKTYSGTEEALPAVKNSRGSRMNPMEKYASKLDRVGLNGIYDFGILSLVQQVKFLEMLESSSTLSVEMLQSSSTLWAEMLKCISTLSV